MAKAAKPEFQAVILAGRHSARLYPMLEGEAAPAPCLLPVANRPLLTYQVDYLTAAGFHTAHVVCEERAAVRVRAFVKYVARWWVVFGSA